MTFLLVLVYIMLLELNTVAIIAAASLLINSKSCVDVYLYML